MPPWLGAPNGILPGIVPLELVLARTPQVAVCVTRLGAYSSGFDLDLVTMASDEADELDPLLFEGRRLRRKRRHDGVDEIPEGMLRFGVEFADGTKATNTADQPLADLAGGTMSVSTLMSQSETPQAPAGPVLSLGGGGGGGGNWRQSIWIWPLPPLGRLTFVCQWPEANIELTRHDIDAQLVLDAATRAQVVFSDALPDPMASTDERGEKEQENPRRRPRAAAIAHGSGRHPTGGTD
jgi:hypothetical protein